MRTLLQSCITWLTGLVFGVGISLSGMVNPAKVINFFDLAGHWDPSLAFVMGGALAVTSIGYQLVFRNSNPVFEAQFHLPASRVIDTQLLAGSAVFGVGWGLSGFCPGGALAALGTLKIEVFAFMLAMLAGMGVARRLDARVTPDHSQPAPSGAPT